MAGDELQVDARDIWQHNYNAAIDTVMCWCDVIWRIWIPIKISRTEHMFCDIKVINPRMMAWRVETVMQGSGSVVIWKGKELIILPSLHLLVTWCLERARNYVTINIWTHCIISPRLASNWARNCPLGSCSDFLLFFLKYEFKTKLFHDVSCVVILSSQCKKNTIHDIHKSKNSPHY